MQSSSKGHKGIKPRINLPIGGWPFCYLGPAEDCCWNFNSKLFRKFEVFLLRAKLTSRQEMASTRSIRFDFESAAVVWKCFLQLFRHRNVGRLFRVIVNNLDLPPSNACAEQERGSKLRTFF